MHPILSATVDVGDRCPVWKDHEPLSPISITIADTLPANSINDVVASQDDIAQRLNLREGPLWLVRIYHTTSTNRFYIALTVCHVITDGRGALKLFETLLSEELDPATAKVSSQTELSFPPSAKAKKRTLWSSSSQSKLSRAKDKVTTAITSLASASKKALNASSLISTPDIVAQLSRFGGHRDMGKIQSILHTAVIVALLASTNASLINEHNSIGTETSVSLRPNEHVSFFGGTYVGLIQRRTTTISLLESKFGEFTSAYNQYIHSEDGMREVRETFNHLEKVPNLADFPTEAGHEDKPYRNSVGISNLGVLKSINDLEEVWSCHTCTPWGNALNVDVVSLDGRIRAIVARSAIDHPPVDCFMTALKFAVRRFAENMDGAAMGKLQDDLLRDVVDDIRDKLRHR
ncbi:hypothetical protein E4T38_05091 [Aureobasidium subglaciale]|nr:hypothetical protein E4T38_05091 [Aureobasidium subglaciale]KAI5222103.1 hypothetical protein E4T40_05129 [Aureobasidium subglaciale]KAI5225945.1 hypothetical protein E4T41_04948 [Aureobasidium subglaciale]KAI5261871.1 hypothetical protein E4T46_04841 [Aureobasidium subglaciale]